MKNIISYICFFLFASTHLLVAQSHQVAGEITTPDGMPLASVRLELQNVNGENQLTFTNEDGSYRFDAVPPGDFRIQVGVDDSEEIVSRDNLTTFDVLLILRHITGIETMDNIYQLKAADVTVSNSITTFDAVRLKAIILEPTIPFYTPSWLYFGEEIEVTRVPSSIFPVTATINNLNFIGVQIGNVGNL